MNVQSNCMNSCFLFIPIYFIGCKDEPNNAKYVFVAEVNNGGNAYKAGIKVGDVIVQLSGTFDGVVDVTGLGIEQM